MARPDDVIIDETPLNGARIDVGSRVGWLLRTSRASQKVSLSTMSRALGEAGVRASTSRLSRAETTGLRDLDLIGTYEATLALAPGQLRAPIDVLIRTFRDAPHDRRPGPNSPAPVAADSAGSLMAYDAAVTAVLDGTATGGDWLRFADAHAPGAAFGLPSALMRPFVDRLVSEMGRAVGTAYVTRYEALAGLRCSPYGSVVQDSVTGLVEAPGTQVLLDAVSAVSEVPTRPLLGWASGLLTHDSPIVVRAGALAIENMRIVGGLPPAAWADLRRPFLAGYARDDPWRRETLTLLFKNLPPALRAAIKADLPAPLAPVRAPDDWTADRRNRHYTLVEDVAAAVCTTVGVPVQPMLTRLLFEVLYDFRASRSVCAAYLLSASPFIAPVITELVDLAGRAADDTTRHGVAGALPMLQPATVPRRVDHWLASDDPALVASALAMAGQDGHRVPADLLEPHLDGPLRQRALYSAGMSGHPRLRAWTRHRDPAVRTGAAWWLAQGSRVTL